MSASGPHRPLVGAGLVFIAVGAWASLWHFFASQSPSSPLHVSFLPGPIQRFAFWSLALGILLPIVARELPAAVPDPAAQRRFARWILAGAGLELAGMGIGAVLSVYGVQIIDPRPKSIVVLALRIFGAAILAVSVTRLAVAWIRRRESAD